MNFKIALVTFLVGAFATTGTAQTTGIQDARSMQGKSSTTWVNPDGYLIDCFGCYSDTNMPPEISDCFYTEPIFKEILKDGTGGKDGTVNRYQYKVLQMYPIAYSTVNGLKYQGVLNLGIRRTRTDEWFARLNVIWIREDGLMVHVIQNIRFRYYPPTPPDPQNPSEEPTSNVEVLWEKTLSRCLAEARTE